MEMNIINIIKEEVKNFDFLGNDEFLKEQEVIDLLMNEELQKQFICDSLLGRNDKVKIVKVLDSIITGNWDEPNIDNANKLGIDYSLKMAYYYEAGKEPINFDLVFSSDNINIGVGGWSDAGRFGGTPDTDIEPSGEAWFDIFDWLDIDVNLFTTDGDEIKFTAYENAPNNIKVLFIREFTQNFIESQTYDIKTSEMRNNIENTPYC